MLCSLPLPAPRARRAVLVPEILPPETDAEEPAVARSALAFEPAVPAAYVPVAPQAVGLLLDVYG
jgi:hypothetical protein